MTVYGIIFYILAFILIISTALAITRTRLVHTVVCLVISFFTTALIFYLMGAPFLAILEVIIYAGAIMVMFLFMIMTVSMEHGVTERKGGSFFRQWIGVVVLSALSLIFMTVLLRVGTDHGLLLKMVSTTPIEFGAYIFREFWFPVELVSLLLFAALVGALYLGRGKEADKNDGSVGEAL